MHRGLGAVVPWTIKLWDAPARGESNIGSQIEEPGINQIKRVLTMQWSNLLVTGPLLLMLKSVLLRHKSVKANFRSWWLYLKI
jgi:hypothetical protein